MTRKDAKASWNQTISRIASQHEHNISHICEDANIFYPPKWYSSSRGTSLSLIDDIFDDIESSQFNVEPIATDTIVSSPNGTFQIVIDTMKPNTKYDIHIIESKDQ